MQFTVVIIINNKTIVFRIRLVDHVGRHLQSGNVLNPVLFTFLFTCVCAHFTERFSIHVVQVNFTRINWQVRAGMQCAVETGERTCFKMNHSLCFHLFVSGTFMLYHFRVLIPHLHPVHGLFTSHSSPSSLKLLDVELNIENLFFLSTAFIFYTMAWLGVSQWNCTHFRCIHWINKNWNTLLFGQMVVWEMCLSVNNCFGTSCYQNGSWSTEMCCCLFLYGRWYSPSVCMSCKGCKWLSVNQQDSEWGIREVLPVSVSIEYIYINTHSKINKDILIIMLSHVIMLHDYKVNHCSGKGILISQHLWIPWFMLLVIFCYLAGFR